MRTAAPAVRSSEARLVTCCLPAQESAQPNRLTQTRVGSPSRPEQSPGRLRRILFLLDPLAHPRHGLNAISAVDSRRIQQVLEPRPPRKPIFIRQRSLTLDYLFIQRTKKFCLLLIEASPVSQPMPCDTVLRCGQGIQLRSAWVRSSNVEAPPPASEQRSACADRRSP